MLFVGIALVIIGIVLVVKNYKNWQRRKRILAAPTSPICQAPGGGPVEIKGRILQSEQGLVQAPFSGRQAVWCRITVEEQRRSGKSSYWETLLQESDERAFFVDDGSGQLARILPDGATCILDPQDIARSGTFNDATPELEAFLTSRGLKSTDWFGFNKTMRYREELFVPGDTLYALGPSRREPGPPVRDGYRTAPSTELVLFADLGPSGELIELILTDKSEEQLTRKLAWGFLGGVVAVVIGILVSIAGLAIESAP